MKTKAFIEKEVELPEIQYASLLTAEEVEAASDYIPDAIMLRRNFPDAYYLRTPGEEEGTVACARGNWLDDDTEVDFDDYGPSDTEYEGYGTGNRPALYFASGLPDAGLPLGSKFRIGFYDFTVISDRIALCDTYISTEIFDEETNDYERSAIKKRVDAWFENQIMPRMERPEKTVSQSSDFVIRNGVLANYTGPGGDVVIPDGVTAIGAWAFSGCKSLTGVVIPDGVTEIGVWAFAFCASLKGVVIPNGVTTIGWNAFRDCSSLTSVVIPDSVTAIGNSAFSGCTSLKGVVIPDGVTAIDTGAFSGCRGLADEQGFVIIKGILFGYFGQETSVVIPNGVTGIDWGAFEGCTGLTSVTIPAGVIKIAENAFDGCEKLTLRAPAGSCAEEYAKKKKIPFEAI